MNSVPRVERTFPVRANDEPQSRLNVAGLWFLFAFLFLSYSRVADVFLTDAHLPLVTSVLALGVAVVSGTAGRGLTSRVGYWLLAFSAWLVVCTPFSFWPGGTFQLLTGQWIKSLLVFVIVASLLQSPKDCLRVMHCIGWAVVAIVLMSLLLGTVSEEGRLMLDQGVLSNPNDLAQLLLVGLPFLLLIASGKRDARLTRLFAAIAVVGVLLVTAKTGSRGAIFGLATLVVLMFVSFTARQRVALVVVLVSILGIVTPFISAEQRSRLQTILSQDSEGPEEALSSTQVRMALLTQSVMMTMSHPIFGVGPGVFEPAAAEYSQRMGERAIWHQTHNSYTQVSSEAGLPGLVLFLGALFSAIRYARRSYKAHLEDTTETGGDLRQMAYFLWLSLIIFAVTACFSSVAYHSYLPTLGGLAVALTLQRQASTGVPRPAARPTMLPTRPLAVNDPLRRPSTSQPV